MKLYKIWQYLPNLKLTAAILSMNMASLLQKQLQAHGVKERFWADSQVVIACIRSNCVCDCKIKPDSKINKNIDQRRQASKKENSANDAFHGLGSREKKIRQLLIQWTIIFLRNGKFWQSEDGSVEPLENDVDVKKEVGKVQFESMMIFLLVLEKGSHVSHV